VLEVSGVICGSLIDTQDRVVLLKFLSIQVYAADGYGHRAAHCSDLAYRRIFQGKEAV
jgi:hypothetical protein